MTGPVTLTELGRRYQAHVIDHCDAFPLAEETAKVIGMLCDRIDLDDKLDALMRKIEREP